MDVAKRLDFDPTDTLTGLQDPAQQRFHTANMAALQDLQQAVQDLSVAAKQKQAQIMAIARQTAEQGIGDNDLKRLQRQFDSNKATFVNIDQKQRFMKGLWDLDLDIDHLTDVKDDQEQQLDKRAEALRTIKAHNEQARQKLSSTCGSISQLYGFVEQATEATAAQLESTRLALQQHAAKQPATAQAPLEPGPGQVEAQQLVEAETAQARELERSIAAAETLLMEMEGKAAADRQQLAALRAEVERMEGLAANRLKAADADKHVQEDTTWCEQMMELTARMTGLSVQDVTDSSISLGIHLCVPTSRQQQHTNTPFREVTHVLTLWFQGGSPLSCSSLDELLVDKFKLAPACVEITDLVVDNEGTEGGMARMVREVRGRLLSYCRRQVLVEAAAEAFPPTSSSRGPPHIRATLDNQVEVEVLVPLSWPSDPDDKLEVVELTAPGLSAEAAQQLMAQVNADQQLAGADVLALLQHVSAEVETHLLDS